MAKDEIPANYGGDSLTTQHLRRSLTTSHYKQALKEQDHGSDDRPGDDSDQSDSQENGE